MIRYEEPRPHTPIMFHPAAVGVDGRVNLFVGNVSVFSGVQGVDADVFSS